MQRLRRGLPRLFLLAAMALTAGCGNIDVTGLDQADFNGKTAGDYTFSSDILPTFATAGCAAANCHDATTHKADLQLTGTAAVVHQSLVDTGVIDIANEASSKLLLAPLATDSTVPHTGATKPFATTSDATYQLWLKWIQQGAGAN